MRTQAMAAAKPKATRSRKAASTKKVASAAKAPAKAATKAPAKASTKAPAKAKTIGKANGVAAAAKTSNRGARSAAGSKSQAGKTGKSSQRGAGKSQQRGSGRGTGKSSQQSMAPQRQGEGTMSPQAAPMFGGTRQVLIEEVAMGSRGGRKPGPEPYPFGDLTPSRLENGAIHGPSFFVPDSENPKRIIAAGRKRHKPDGKVFLTRQMEGPSVNDPKVLVSGTRVWLAPEGYNE